MLMHRSPW